MASRKFDFVGLQGYTLSGVLEAPEGTPRGWAIFAHCLTCGKDSLAAVRVACALSRAGIGVLRFDFAGIGKSGGTFRDATFATDIDDIVAAAEAMTAANMAPSILVGHSMGGTAVIAAATRIQGIAAVATLAAPADASAVTRHFDPRQLDKIMRDGEAQVEIADRSFIVRRSFIEEIARHDIERQVAGLGRPLLVMHAPADSVVGIEHASRLFLAAKHPKSFVSLDSADHLLTKAEDANYAAAIIGAWASRYLPPLVADVPQVSDSQGVSARETGAGALQVEIVSGPYRLIADEPVAVGGLGTGPSPYELISAGLAACTIMTMRLYANSRGLPLEHAQVTVDHVKVADMTPPDRFNRIITIDGPLDADQRARILAIADRCPVDLTLVRGSDVQTQLAGDPQAMPSPVIGE